MKSLITILFVLFSFKAISYCGDISVKDTEEYQFINDIEIKTNDGEYLSANLFIPKISKTSLPTIIFGNSWLLDEHEYLVQAKLLASLGFQVLSYSTRGWGCSSGFVDIMGKQDMNDLSKVIDWLESNTQVDVKNIGISGISYGGGLTLMGLVTEKRIKTGFAMSTWADLGTSLFGQGTLRAFWGGFLASSGMIFGNLSDESKASFMKYANYEELDTFYKWAKSRSPIEYTDKLKNKPIYIANNLQDHLFQPNQMIHFYNHLRGPKVLELNQGSHLTAEVSGLLTRYNKTFERMREWFSYWLKGEKLQTIKLNSVTFDVDDIDTRVRFETNDFEPEEFVFYLVPSSKQKASLRKLPYIGLKQQMSFDSNRDSFATSGIPFLSAVIDSHFEIPVYTFLPFYWTKSAVVYEAKPLGNELKLRGIPKLNLNVEAETRFQLVTYLYEVNSFGIGRLLTHGVVTSNASQNNLDIELVALANNIKAENKLVLVIDGEDVLYGEIPERRPEVKIKFNSFKQNKIVLPIMNN